VVNLNSLNLDFKVRFGKEFLNREINDWQLTHLGVILGFNVCKCIINSQASSLYYLIQELPISDFNKFELYHSLIGDCKIQLSLWLYVNNVDNVINRIKSYNYVSLGTMRYQDREWIVFVRNWKHYVIDIAITKYCTIPIPRKAIQYITDIITKPWKWIKFEINGNNGKLTLCHVNKFIENTKNTLSKLRFYLNFEYEKPIEQKGKCWNVENTIRLFNELQSRSEVIGIAHSNTYFVYVLSRKPEETKKFIKEKLKIEKGYIVIEVK